MLACDSPLHADNGQTLVQHSLVYSLQNSLKAADEKLGVPISASNVLPRSLSFDHVRRRHLWQTRARPSFEWHTTAVNSVVDLLSTIMTLSSPHSAGKLMQGHGEACALFSCPQWRFAPKTGEVILRSLNGVVACCPLQPPGTKLRNTIFGVRARYVLPAYHTRERAWMSKRKLQSCTHFVDAAPESEPKNGLRVVPLRSLNHRGHWGCRKDI